MGWAEMSETREDRSLFGPGRYPDAGPLAVASRLSFIGAVAAIIVAVYLPPSMVPRFARSHYLEHFAAFYVATVMAVAALPRARLMRIGFGMALFAVTLEVLRAAPSLHVGWTIAPAEADLGGVLAALAPIVAEKFRSLFDPREFS